MLNKIKVWLKGAASDSFFLMFVRMVTMVFGLLMTRMLSGHFSLAEYGTYSQVLLITTTVSSMTILGMMDGINFFFCKEKDEKKRDTYVSTIFFLHYVVGIAVSVVILCCAIPISKYFDNESLKSLIIFAAVLPVLQNSISLLQIMFIAIGRARLIAIRNLIVSIAKMLAILLACYVFDNVAIVLLFQLLTDLVQIVYFFLALRKQDYKINIFKFDTTLIKEILVYCIPMAMFAVIKSLNRDSDKFVISFFTDTETLAVYTNASKLLPFDIVMSSFCTVLLPYITRYIANKDYKKTQELYRSFLELSYISTAVLATGAICVAPEMMRFLYTDKYAAYSYGITVFIIYTVVDILSVLNITLILSAAGKTKTILLASIGTFISNIILNIGLYFASGEIGPAIATLIVTFVQGVIILSLSAREIKINFIKMFDIKYLLFFILQITIGILVFSTLRNFAIDTNIHYFVIMVAIYSVYVGLLLLVNSKRLIKNLKLINSSKT